MDIWEAASSVESLQFTFVGAVIALPLIIGYTVVIYRIFGGKTRGLGYE